MIFGVYILQQSYQKKNFDRLCGDSIDKSELEDSFSIDFQVFIQKVTPDIRKKYFKSMEDLRICKICISELNVALFMKSLI